MINLSERGNTYAMFAIAIAICALGSLTQTVMNPMLGGVQADLGVDVSVSQWLTTAYMLVMGVTVPVVTFLAQKMSTRSLMALSLAVFIAGALVSLFSGCFLVLLAGRVLQAVAAGISLPLVQSIAMTRFPRGQNATAMGIAGIAMGFAPNIGPLIGGVLVDSWGWRSFFALAALALLALLAADALLVRREAPRNPAARLESVSFALSTLGFGGLLLAFSNAAGMSPASPLVWLPACVGAFCLVLFVRRQMRLEAPLISMSIFESRRYRTSYVAQNLLFASFMGITLVVPLCVTGPMGATPLDAGLVFVPATLVAVVANPLAGVLADKIGVRPVVVVASAFLAAGACSMVFVHEAMPLWLLTLLQTIRAVGVSALIGPLNSWGMTGLPHEVMMDASAFFAASRQAFASLGTALMMLFVTGASALALAGSGMAGYQLALAFSALLSVCVLVLAVWKVR